MTSLWPEDSSLCTVLATHPGNAPSSLLKRKALTTEAANGSGHYGCVCPNRGWDKGHVRTLGQLSLSSESAPSLPVSVRPRVSAPGRPAHSGMTPPPRPCRGGTRSCGCTDAVCETWGDSPQNFRGDGQRLALHVLTQLTQRVQIGDFFPKLVTKKEARD